MNVRATVTDPNRSSITLHQHPCSGLPLAGAAFIPAQWALAWPGVCSWLHLSVSRLGHCPLLYPQCSAQVGTEQELRKCWLNHSDLVAGPQQVGAPAGLAAQPCRVGGRGQSPPKQVQASEVVLGLKAFWNKPP